MEKIFGEENGILANRNESDIQDSYWNEMRMFSDFMGNESHM
jgi:hypothetical protein